MCPIEVIRADGIYEGQTNPTEANCVVDVLATIWSAVPEARPSIGVVTFNRKQADLVEDAIQRRALKILPSCEPTNRSAIGRKAAKIWASS